MRVTHPGVVTGEMMMAHNKPGSNSDIYRGYNVKTYEVQRFICVL